jgi:hypothetical protein
LKAGNSDEDSNKSKEAGYNKDKDQIGEQPEPAQGEEKTTNRVF